MAIKPIHSNAFKDSSTDIPTDNSIFDQLPNNFAKERIQRSILQDKIEPFLKEVKRQHPHVKIELIFRQRITTKKHAHTDADILVIVDDWVMAQIECAHLGKESYKVVSRDLNPRRDKLHQYAKETTLFRIHPNCTYSYLLWGGDETYCKPSYQQKLKANNWLSFHSPNIDHLNTPHTRATTRFLTQTITTAVEKHMFNKEATIEAAEANKEDLAVVVEDVVAVDYVIEHFYCAYALENDECEPYYSADFSALSSSFSHNVYPLPRQQEIEMQQYRLMMGYMENPELIRYHNVWREYQIISHCEELRRILQP